MSTDKHAESGFLKDNMNCWNDRVPVHIKSDFYGLTKFLNGNSVLTEIEHEFLGNVSGLRILHLQCHFGMDTLSLSRMGAHCVGIDFSPVAILEAKKLNQQISQNAEFIECSVYEVPALKLNKFDKVFTTYGTVGWLPDLDKWAKVISDVLLPSGELYFCDFHPVLYMFDFNTHQPAYSYFNTGLPYSEEETGTYADQTYNKPMISHFWSHSLDEILGSLLANNLSITLFKEFDYSPYSCFPNMREIGVNKFRFGPDALRIPHLYLIKAVKI